MTQLISHLPTLEMLPSTYAIALTEFSAINLTGDEQTAYLQGQVTCDVTQLNDHNMLCGAHCDAKGKVFSVFRLINRFSSHLLLQPKSSIETSLNALQKFAIFSKVTIESNQTLSFYAVVGEQAQLQLTTLFKHVPDASTPVVQSDSTTLVYIHGKQPRYLLIDETEILEAIMNQCDLPLYNHQLWNLLEITEGFPLLSQPVLQHYVPQMLNLQAIDGISFTKGCYIGQETVARMQYLGKNKRALFSLFSTNNATISALKQTDELENKTTIDSINGTTINTGDIIEKQIGENWRKAGEVLISYQTDISELQQQTCYLQAVLASDVDQNTVLRLKNQPTITLSLADLPYDVHKEA